MSDDDSDDNDEDDDGDGDPAEVGANDNVEKISQDRFDAGVKSSSSPKIYPKPKEIPKNA